MDEERLVPAGDWAETMPRNDEARLGYRSEPRQMPGSREGRAGTQSMRQKAAVAMPLKGDFNIGPPEASAILSEPGEVAEWLKAAPC